MKVLVTGGAGFIGSNLVDELIAMGHKVYVLDNLSTGRKENINPKAVFLRCDVNNGFPNLTENFDWVFHLAATVGVKRTLEDPLSVLDDVKGIRNVLEFCRLTNVSRVIFSSSSEVYGNPVEFPEREDGHVNPQLPYAVVKLYGEKLLEAYHDMYGLNTTNLRFFNVYGPRQEGSDYGFVVGVFINQVLAGKAPSVYGDGSNTRDFVFVRDNIRAMLEIVENDELGGETINVGNGRPITISALAENIIKIAGKTIKPEFFPDRAYEIRHRFPDISKLRRIINYAPKYDLDDGLRITFDYYKNMKERE